MSLEDRHRSITIRGLVCPSEWDTENRVCRVSILTFDDDEYEVEPRDAGEYLLQHARQEVMARGHLLPGFRKRKVVLIKSFTVFGPHTIETIENDSDLSGSRGPGRQAAR
jgi:hypothetical protein